MAPDIGALRIGGSFGNKTYMQNWQESYTLNSNAVNGTIRVINARVEASFQTDFRAQQQDEQPLTIEAYRAKYPPEVLPEIPAWVQRR